MIPEVVVFAQVVGLAVAAVGALCGIGVLTMRAVQRTNREPPAMQRPDARLEQLQQSVDAIALEVERIAEAQRFSTNLLAERAEGDQIGR